MRWNLFLFIVCIGGLTACSKNESGKCRVSIHIFAPGEKIYLSRVPYIDEKRFVLDSAIIKGKQDSIVFEVPIDPDRLYELRIPNSLHRFFFVADAPYIQIQANGVSGKFTATSSVGTLSLIDFYGRRSGVISHARKIKATIDSLYKTGLRNGPLLDSLSKNMNDSLMLTQTMNRNFADTTSSPAAFLAVYNGIDFGDDRALLKKTVAAALQRFPQSKAVADLDKEVLEMISIYEQEFNVGDTLPPIQLPDADGRLLSTESLKGKFYLIDFWATWCPRCLAYNSPKAMLFSKIKDPGFQMVSVALDNNADDWKNMISKNHYDWIQLLDEKMWRGRAARTLKFDSIPFNFLVSPKGIILAKAIHADSLVETIQRLVR